MFSMVQDLLRCKVDSVSLGVMPGRRVAAVRWEGVSEGITYHQDSVQSFKQNVGREPGNAQGINPRIPFTGSIAGTGSTTGARR